MIDQNPILLTDVFTEIVQNVDNVLFSTLNKHILFQYGSSVKILNKLVSLNNAIASKTNRFPLVALFMPFTETKQVGFYSKLTIPKLVICALSNGTDDVSKRMEVTFKPILEPIYQELLNQISYHKMFLDNTADFLPHVKKMNPGAAASKDSKFNEFVDAIEIYNLELKTLNN